MIRVDNRAAFVAAWKRIAAILNGKSDLSASRQASSILLEGYIPGVEVALEGLLDSGRLQVLALFDKPDPLEGPFFEETLYITPSRLSESRQRAIAMETAAAAGALGLRGRPHSCRASHQ